MLEIQRAALQAALTHLWCRQRDLNSYDLGSPPPQDGVSTNFTMSAKFERYYSGITGLLAGAAGVTGALTG